MDLPKHYSLAGEKEDHFLIHDSRDGSKFKVARKPMHPGHQLKIMKMKKLSGGGTSDPEDTGEDGIDEGAKFIPPGAAEMASPAPTPAGIDNEPMAAEAPPQPEATADNINAAQEPPPGIAAQPGTTPPAVPPKEAAPAASYPTSAELQASQKQQIEGVQQEATATQKQNEAMAAQYQKNLAEEQKVFEMHNSKLNQYQAQYDKMVTDVAAQKIDPERYMHNKSTGSKIAAAIGMMLSGIGSGLTGQPNMAMQVLNKHIENDIESQKANLGIKQSLLSHNLAAQGNMMSAMNSTRLQMAAMAQGKLQLVAAQTGNPIIAARALQNSAKISESLMPLRGQVAGNEVQMQIKKDVMQRLAGQGQPGSQPVDMQDLSRAGLVSQATAEKEGSAISKRQQAEAFVIDQFNKMKEEARFWGNGVVPNVINPQSQHRYGLARAGIIQAIQSASTSKRLNPEMLALEARPFFVNMFESDETEQTSLNGLLGLIRSHADPTPMATHFKIPGAINGPNTVPKNFNMGPVK